MQINVTKQADKFTSGYSNCMAVVAASEFNEQLFLLMHEAGTFSKIIAADAGFTHLKNCGICPDFAIGDFDGMGSSPQNTKTSVQVFPKDKDWTDLELAVNNALECGAQRLYVFGALGGKRLDMTLSTMQIMTRVAQQGLVVTAIGTNQSCTTICGPADVEFLNITELDKSKPISIVAQSDAASGLNSAGFKWNYSNSTLSNCQTLGVSNELVSDTVSLSVGLGCISIIF